MHHNDVLHWGHLPSDRYEPGFFIGSTGDDGEHLRDDSGWPYSIYKRSSQVGVSDVVLCHGIQERGDADRLLTLITAAAHYSDGLATGSR